AQLLELADGAPAGRPFRAVAEPAEKLIEPSSGKRLRKLHRGSTSPATPAVLLLALLDDLGGPAFGEAGKIDFTRGNCRRLPVDRVNHALVQEHIFRIEFAMNYRRRDRQQLIRAFAKAPAE